MKSSGVIQTAAGTPVLPAPQRMDEVWQQLGTVVDPELDESVTEMNFISRAAIDESNCVHVDFRLPTYWCAANFAFMMADDMRTALRALPWVEKTKIVLCEHMYADAINTGIAEGRSFVETFGKEADGDIEEVRRTFLIKAFQRRQVAVINHLIACEVQAERIVEISIAELSGIAVDAEGDKLIARYLERRFVAGETNLLGRAFVKSDGSPLTADGLPAYLVGLRRVRANAEFNGALCRGLLNARFDLETPLGGKPGERCRDRPAASNT